MFERLNRRKSAAMHRIALERLQRAQDATAEYVRVRVDRGLTEKFDAWDVRTARTAEAVEEADEARGADGGDGGDDAPPTLE